MSLAFFVAEGLEVILLTKTVLQALFCHEPDTEGAIESVDTNGVSDPYKAS